jgi:hypothetical protein
MAVIAMLLQKCRRRSSEKRSGKQVGEEKAEHETNGYSQYGERRLISTMRRRFDRRAERSETTGAKRRWLAKPKSRMPANSPRLPEGKRSASMGTGESDSEYSSVDQHHLTTPGSKPPCFP